jgi:hypothetical protein
MIPFSIHSLCNTYTLVKRAVLTTLWRQKLRPKNCAAQLGALHPNQRFTFHTKGLVCKWRV